jgi:serine/threonine-protein kinase
MTDLVGRLRAALAGRYTIRRELGRGGMATVYLAHDLKHDRSVALKVLKPELAHALGPERFLREITLTAKLDHPHILPLLDSGDLSLVRPLRAAERGSGGGATASEGEATAEPGGKFLYYVMPYVEGESLRERLDREKQLPLDDALQIAREVADALGYAHSRGIVHRDIKPENILLAGGHARVADFGIARAVAAAGGESMTETGLAIGTAAYMSPEQAAGSKDLDGRSDLYSLGCVLYEMLAGEPPHSGRSAQAIFAKRLSEPVPRISVLRETVSSAIEHAVSRALAKAPADRFATAGEFAIALEGSRRALDQVHTDRRSSKTPRAWRAGLAATGLLALLAAAAWVVSTGRSNGSGAISSLAVLPLDNFMGDVQQDYFVDGMTEALIAELAKIEALRVISRTSVIRFKTNRPSLPQVARELDVDAVVEGSVMRSADSVRITVQLIRAEPERHLWAESYHRDLEHVLALQSEVASAIAGAIQLALSPEDQARLGGREAPNPEALDYFLRGNAHAQRPGGPWESAQAALEMYERAVATDSTFAEAFAALGRWRVWMAWQFNVLPPPFSRAELRGAARQALEQASRLRPDDSGTQEAWGWYYYYGFLDYDSAQRHFERALEQQPNNADLLLRVGGMNVRQGKWEQGAAAWARAIELDPLSALALREAGYGLTLMRRYADAERYLDRSLAIAPGPGTRKVLLHLMRGGSADSLTAILARAPAESRRQVLSRTALRPFIERFASDLDGYHPARTGTVFVNGYLARASLALQRAMPQVARVHYDSARAVLEERLRAEEEAEGDGELTGSAPTSLAWLGYAYAALGRREDALRAGRRATILRPVSADARGGAEIAEILARTYAVLGEREQAIDQLEFLLSVPSELSVPLLRADPEWDGLRDHPRFQALLARGDRQWD